MFGNNRRRPMVLVFFSSCACFGGCKFLGWVVISMALSIGIAG